MQINQSIKNLIHYTLSVSLLYEAMIENSVHVNICKSNLTSSKNVVLAIKEAKHKQEILMAIVSLFSADISHQFSNLMMCKDADMIESFSPNSKTLTCHKPQATIFGNFNETMFNNYVMPSMEKWKTENT